MNVLRTGMNMSISRIHIWLCNMYKQNIIEKCTKDCILPFPKKGDLSITNNYREITLIAIAAKVYHALLLNCIQPEIVKILEKNQNGFQSTTSHICRIIEGV